MARPKVGETGLVRGPINWLVRRRFVCAFRRHPTEARLTRYGDSSTRPKDQRVCRHCIELFHSVLPCAPASLNPSQGPAFRVVKTTTRWNPKAGQLRLHKGRRDLICAASNAKV